MSSVNKKDEPIVAPEPAAYFVLRPAIRANARMLGGRRTVALQNEETGKFYHLGTEEFAVLSLLTGNQPLSAVQSRLHASGIIWSTDDIKTFIAMLVKDQLVMLVDSQGDQQASNEPPAAKAPVANWQRAMSAVGHLLSQRLALGNADRIAAFSLPWLGFAFSPLGIVAWLIAVTIACGIALTQRHEIVVHCHQVFSPEAWPVLLLVGVALKAVHELGHAVAAKYQGVRIGDVGVTFFMFTPLAYVDVTNAWKLPSRWSRIQIALGGVYFEGWLASAATIMFAWLDDGLARHLALQVMLIAGPATWLVNANPLLRLDGYFVLSDLLDIPNLRMHGRRRWAMLLDHWLLGKPVQSGLLHGWRRWAATIHAAASVIFQILWMSGLVLAVSHWAGLVGLILAIAAIASWCVFPLAMWWMRHWNAPASDTVDRSLTRRRMLTLTSSMLLLLTSILAARNPFARTVPVVVQHRNEQIGRAAADGFVSAVLVRGGQLVRRGDLLVEVVDEDLRLRHGQLSDDYLLNMAKYRQSQNLGKLADAASAIETAKQLQASILELDAAIATLRIVATRDGMVVSERPEHWMGRFAKQGDILIRVADPRDKEVVVAIDEQDVSPYLRAVERGLPLAARVRGGQQLSVEPMAIQPQFSSRLPHPAMSATIGGDVPVIPDADSPDGFKSASPLGEATARISPTQSMHVYVGQRGRMYLDDDQSILTRLTQLIRF